MGFQSGIRMLLMLFLSIAAMKAYCQSHSKCGQGPVNFSNYCDDACVVCDLNGVTGRTTNTIIGQAPPGFCTMVVHSMQWLAFVAGSTNLSINVSVSNCNQPNGIEMGIYESFDCASFTLVSNCNTNMYDNQTWPFVTTSPLKVGCIYYLVFDGNGPNSCDVSFTVTSGSTKAPIPNTSNKIVGKTKFCVGESETYSIPPIVGACDYQWRVVNGSLVSFKDNKAEVLWDKPGMGQICVRGSNICNDGNEVCLDVIIGEPSPPTDLGPFFVCSGKSYKYNNQLFQAGVHDLIYKNIYGCDSLVHLVIDEYPLISSKSDTSICWPDQLKIGKNTFDSSGKYTVFLRSTQSPFCDSIVDINLNYFKLQIIPNKSNDLSCSDTLVTLFADSSIIKGKGIINYYWISEVGDTLGRNKSVLVNRSGKFKLVFEIIDSVKQGCIAEKIIEVKGSHLTPNIELMDSVIYCFGDTLFFNQIKIRDNANTNSIYTYHTQSPCTQFNQLQNTEWIVDRDTIIYIKATSGMCFDELPVRILTMPNSQVNIAPIDICPGEAINLLKLTKKYSGIPPDSISYYWCADYQNNCNIRDSVLYVKQDTTIYFLPEGVLCPLIGSFRIHIKPIPDPSFSFITKDICFNDSIHVLFANQNINAQLKWINSLDTLLIPFGNQSFKWLDSLAGKKVVCVSATLDQCISSFCDSFTIHRPILPKVDCYSTDSTVIFTWNKSGSNDYQITILNGAVGEWLNDSTLIFKKLMRGEKINIRVSSTDSLCPLLNYDIDCQAKSCPPVDVVIEGIDTICLNTFSPVIQLSAIHNDVNPSGKLIWGGNGIVDSIAGLFDPKKAGPGNHKIFVIYRVDGCIYPASYNIIVRQNPFAEFVIDSVICQDSILSINVNHWVNDSAKISWNFGGGMGKTIDRDHYEVHWSSPGKKKLGFRISESRCYHDTEKEIEVIPALEKPMINCISTDTSVTFIWKQNNRIKNITPMLIQGPLGRLINDSSYQVKVANSKDKIIFKLGISDTGPCSPIESDTIVCQPIECPFQKLIVDTTIALCDHSISKIPLDQFEKKPSLFIEWLGLNITNKVLDFNLLSIGRHQYIGHLKTDFCEYYDTLNIEKYALPKISELVIKPISCAGPDSLGQIISINSTIGLVPYQYAIDLSPFQDSVYFDQIIEGNHLIQIKDQHGCVADTVVYFKQPIRPVIDIGPDWTILRGQRVDLLAHISGSEYKLFWESKYKFLCDTCKGTSLKPDDHTLVYATVVSKDGCMSTDELSITVVQNNVYAPDLFSPNGDGINDGFTIFGNDAEIKEITSLDIYDRWGEIVFSKQHFRPNIPEEGWNGFFKQNPCMNGVYVFNAVVAFHFGSDVQISGNLTLIR